MSYLQQSHRATLIASLIRMSGRTRLDEIAARIWRAHADGELSDDEAQALARMVENSRGRTPWQRADAEGMDDVEPARRKPFIR